LSVEWWRKRRLKATFSHGKSALRQLWQRSPTCCQCWDWSAIQRSFATSCWSAASVTSLATVPIATNRECSNADQRSTSWCRNLATNTNPVRR